MADHQPDPHVVSLRYSMHHREDLTYESPPPVEFETDEARFRLAGNKLTCEMKVHFAAVEEARKAVEPTLKAWEVDAALRRGPGHLSFDFEGAHSIDRAPRPPGQLTVGVGSAIQARASVGPIAVHATSKEYPAPPPSTFRLNPDAESILNRYEGYRDGREHLEGMAYFCVTFANFIAGGSVKGIGAAAQKYRISEAVLRKIKTLASTRGDHVTARKGGVAQPLTGSERKWLEEAVKILIWRVGDTKVTALPQITMANLPKI